MCVLGADTAKDKDGRNESNPTTASIILDPMLTPPLPGLVPSCVLCVYVCAPLYGSERVRDITTAVTFVKLQEIQPTTEATSQSHQLAGVPCRRRKWICTIDH